MSGPCIGLPAAIAASQRVRDDVLHAEVILLRDENTRLRAAEVDVLALLEAQPPCDGQAPLIEKARQIIARHALRQAS